MSSMHVDTVMITSGPTREWLDPVRFISNPASGRTGWHLAETAKKQFQKIIYICGPVHPPYHRVEGAINISVETTEEMHDAVHNSLEDSCLLFMTAAPADFYYPAYSESKIKKSEFFRSEKSKISLKLEPTVDILKSIIPRTPHLSNFYRIGFSAETHNILERSLQKLKSKELDLICANQVYQDFTGFGDNPNTIFLLDRNGKQNTIGPCGKEELAELLLEYTTAHLLVRETPPVR